MPPPTPSVDPMRADGCCRVCGGSLTARWQLWNWTRERPALVFIARSTARAPPVCTAVEMPKRAQLWPRALLEFRRENTRARDARFLAASSCSVTFFSHVVSSLLKPVAVRVFPTQRDY